MIKKLEELILDIRESGLKNKEILRRLLSVAQKEVEDFIQSEEKEEIVEEPLPIPIQNTNEVMKIGKFYVLKESVEDNPVNIQKIVQLLAKEDQKEIYFASGESVEKIDHLPTVEMVKDKGFIFYI